MAKPTKREKRLKRHQRLRNYLIGTPDKPRLCVFRSNKNIFCQIIDDVNHKTLASASTIDKELKAEIAYGGNKDAAEKVGRLVAERALELGIKTVVFDRGGYVYHGRVLALAEGARAAGLDF